MKNKQRKAKILLFLFLAIYLAAPLEMLLEAKEAVGGIFCFSFKIHIKIT